MSLDWRIRNPLTWPRFPLLPLVVRQDVGLPVSASLMLTGFIKAEENLEVKPILYLGNILTPELATPTEYPSLEAIFEEWQVD